jgi:hypothetical protein
MEAAHGTRGRAAGRDRPNVLGVPAQHEADQATNPQQPVNPADVRRSRTVDAGFRATPSRSKRVFPGYGALQARSRDSGRLAKDAEQHRRASHAYFQACHPAGRRGLARYGERQRCRQRPRIVMVKALHLTITDRAPRLTGAGHAGPWPTHLGVLSMRRSIYPTDITTEVQNLNRTSLRTYSR